MTVRVAVIGLGYMGKTHLAAYRAAGDACRLVGVYDSNPDRLRGESAEGGNIETEADPCADAQRLFDPNTVFATDSLDALLAHDEIDAVSICTPTDTHAPIATAALRAGKHVLVEKPVALDLEQIEALDTEASNAGRLCMPAMCIRFWPAWAWLADRIRDQQFGPLRSLALERIGSVPAWGGGFYEDESRSGGALFDLHIHDTDFVCAALGTPDAVTTAGDRARMTTMYHYEGKNARLLITASGGWMRGGAGFRMRFLAEFERGTADFDLARSPQLLLSDRGELRRVEIPTGTGYEHEITSFVRAASTGRDAPVTLIDAMLTTRVLLAEAESIETRQRQSL